MTNKYSNFNKDTSSSENIESNQIKTTDVNILLNRVRLDKKKTIQKNMLVSLLLVGLVSSITIFFII
tara:strand:+ start:843 stop:1043 length:201 start_codon:yes stop_codon:yes gene_type:complete